MLKFRLSARARVAFKALRGGRVVGRGKTRVLARGRWRVVLPYRGRRPPTDLAIDVKPARAAGARIKETPR